MPKRTKKFIRCPHFDKNLWIIIETERDIDGEDMILCMTCKERDALQRENKDCGVPCNNYFYHDD